MVEAVMFWNEPNNKSHWAFEIDPEWRLFGDLVKRASAAVADVNPRVLRVLGGMSPIDPNWTLNMKRQGVLERLDAIAVHGFPLDWNHWALNDWPTRLQEIKAVTALPVWVSEVGVSTFGADEVQVFGLNRTAELLIGRAPRIRSAQVLAGDDAASRVRGLFLLPAFLHGPDSGGRYAQTRVRRFQTVRSPHGNLPVVPL
jgi:beta-xylosidase